MRTIVITGGTDGIGRQLALELLRAGDRVLVIGRNTGKGEALRREADRTGSAERFLFLQADLSLISENRRIVEEVGKRTDRIDRLILCAQSQKFSRSYRETAEGFETHFGLYYLSRFFLSHAFRRLLEQGASPVIVNICAPGVKGEIRWSDLQLRTLEPFNSIKAILHGSRLNDRLGAGFAHRNADTKIKYVLYNPGAVRTKGATEAFEQKLVKLLVQGMYALIGQSAEEAVKPIFHLLDHPPAAALSAYKRYKQLDISELESSQELSEKLYRLTVESIG